MLVQKLIIDPLMATVGSAMATAIVALAFYIKSLHTSNTAKLAKLYELHIDEQKQNLVAMTEATIKTASVIQNNNEITKETNTLLHSMNLRQLQNDARNGNN